MTTEQTEKRDQTREYHERFAESIIKQLEAGTAPWQKPWKPGEPILPVNAIKGQSYGGGNSVYLAVRGTERGFSDNRWATYRQIAAAGGHVRKGERGEKILFFDTTQLVPKKDAKGQPVIDADGRKVYDRLDRPKPFWSTYTVFNVEQTEGLNLPSRDAPQADWQAHAAAEAVIDTAKVPMTHVQGDSAYYSPREDQIVLPERTQFPSAEHYYATALHELGHATGHESRLNRETFKKGVAAGFGSPDYAKEELRAEISAMMTGDRLGTGHNPQHGTAYVASWVKALRDEPREVYRAAAEADKISHYLVDPARERIQAIGKEAPP